LVHLSIIFYIRIHMYWFHLPLIFKIQSERFFCKYFMTEQTPKFEKKYSTILTKQSSVISLNKTIKEDTKQEVLESLANLLFDYDYKLIFTLYDVVDVKEKTELLEMVTLLCLKYKTEEDLFEIMKKSIIKEIEETPDIGNHFK
jgi:hypothetical protein